ncbi:cytochrome-c peroxidase [Flavobacterium rhizosphaerae]|uniref:Cytochrome c peroxidase n=1 Tax=Flavobacterium rhizosphaerae TaxID=3163298 RepID=A0ABW8YUL5_9FLAO
MKNLYALPFIFIFCFIALKTLPLPKSETYYTDDFRAYIIKGANAFADECEQLKKASDDFKNGTITLEQLQNEVAKTRLAYKNIETITEYYYPQHCKAYLNGAPLKHPDPYPVNQKYSSQNYYGVTPEEYSKDQPLDYLDIEHYKGERKIIDPVGLQALDELVFSEEATQSAGRITELAYQLENAVPAIQIALQKRNFFYDFEIIEAARLEVVRILSLGITGFDTPGSLQALPESAVALASLQSLIKPLTNKTTGVLGSQVQGLALGAAAYLTKHNNFNTFDRLEFLTVYINPLYKKLGEVQQQLHLPSSAERWGKVPAWNAASTNIFSEDFLNPYYYSLLPQEKDNDSLRALGKKLFYEPLLSNSGTMSCASCHDPKLAFTDGLPTSAASVEGKNVLRNAPTLINAVFSDCYFYDLRAYDLEEQAEHVVENHLEFNTSFANIEKQLNKNDTYKNLFYKVFGNKKPINRYQFAQALSSYVLSLRSFDSEFDRYVQGKSTQLPKQVKDGFNLFAGKAACATCHYIPTFSGLVPPLFEESETEVLGVLKSADEKVPDNDLGRYNSGIPQDKEDIYRRSFKTSTVRNAALTAPYFHNGGYKTLEEVLEFYDQGGAAGMGFEYEIPNQTLAPDALNLSNKEKKAIIAFIKSLNSNPFP